MITVLVSSTGSQLATVDALKDMILGATATSTANDDLLSTYITRASDAVEQYLGYPLRRQVYRETVPAFGDLSLLLSRTPVVAIGSLYDGEDLISDTGYTIEEPEAGLLQREEGFPWTAAMGMELEMRPIPGSERRQFSITYEAGYVLDGSTTTGDWLTNTTGRTLPHWAEQATLETAKEFYLKRSLDHSIQSKRIGDLSITYGNVGWREGMSQVLPTAALALLRNKARSI
jgi:hypothetical protein